MSLLVAKNYDPLTLVTKSTAAAAAMTAFDTTNLRASFNAPTSGNVLVRIVVPEAGSTTIPGILLGVMDGATVVAKVVPKIGAYSGNASTCQALEAVFTVTGLTSGAALNWDAAFAVEFPVASTSLRYGGPNDAVSNNSYGAFLFEVWTA